MESLAIVCFSTLFFHFSDAGSFTWLYSDDTVHFVEGKTAKLNWSVQMSAGKTWVAVKITRSLTIGAGPGDADMIRRKPSGVDILLAERGADMDLDVQEKFNVLNVTFTLRNLLRKTDEMYYRITVFDDDPDTSVRNTKLNVDALSLSFTRKPEDPLIVVLNSNSSNVDFRWDFSLANGETLQYFYFRRHEKDKGYALSRVTLGGTFTNPNTTLYSMDMNISSPGPSSGYIRFTIKDIMKQKDNSDGSKANPLSIDYVYSLWIKTSISNDETSSFVELKVLVRPTITMYGCQGCVNGSVIENQTITLVCNATGKPMPNIRWTKNGEPYNVSSPGNTLIIPQVTRDDKGNYTCIADNGIGIQDNKTIPVLVKYKPDAPSLSPATFDACENKSINVNCMADAYPPVTNYSLYNGNNYLGSNSNGQFSITATPPGKNTLCCVASNEIGNSQCGHAAVDVLGVITPVCRINNETTSAATVNEGDEVVLQCDISGNESYYSYRWLEVKDGISRNTRRAIQLRFDSINRTNEAQYQVILTDKLNCFASQLRSFNITVNYKPENTMFSSHKKVFCEGNSTQVHCTADGKPDPVYSLYRNNEYLSGNENGVFLLTFAEKGNYKYTCVPNNTAGVGPNKSQNVVVKGPLNSRLCTINNKTISHIQVKELSLVDMRLVSSELERLDCTWQNGTSIMAGLDSHNLTIGSILRHEGGTYRVVARDRSNCSANVECIFTVEVHYSPDQPTILSSPTVNEGETVNLTCKAEANPKPYYLWMFMGKVLQSESNGTIRISNITLDDAGDYSCIAVNYLGNTTASRDLRVEYFREPSCEAVPAKVEKGAAITLNCSVAAYPVASYIWKMANRIIAQTSTIIVTASWTLNEKSFICTAANYRESKNCTTAPLEVLYGVDLNVIGSSNKSYTQSNPVVLFNLSVNAYPSNTSLTCNPSVPNVMTVITNYNAGLQYKHYLVVVIIQNVVETANITCIAENSMDKQEKTLFFYRQPILFKEQFEAQFKMTNQEWQDELKDPKTAEYMNLAKKCIKIIENAYSGLPYLAGINIKKFLKGSILVRFELEVIGQVSDPLLPLKDYIKREGGEIDGLQIDYNSIQKSSELKDDSPIPVPEDSKTLVAVLGALLALSIILNILLIARFLWLRRKDSRGFKKRSNNSDEIGQMNEISMQETSLNDTPNVPEYEPIGRRGLASNTGIPEYEAVSTRTQPTQPQSAVETNNPMPQYESADRHRLPGADSNPTSVTYQTIQSRTDDYGSLSPSTRLPPRDKSTGSPTSAGEYQALHHKGVASQYQSLDDLSRC